MKKLLTLILVTALALSMGSVFTSFAEETAVSNVLDETGLVNIDAVTESTPDTIGTYAGYSENVIKFLQHGQYIYLGEIDLSKYSSVDFLYGCDVAAAFNGNKPGYICLTKNGPVQDSNKGAAIRDAEIIATAELNDGDGLPWEQSEKYAFADLDTDYCGPVYLTMSIGKTRGEIVVDGETQSIIRQDGLVITEVFFDEKKPETPPPAATEVVTAMPTAVATEEPVAEEGCGGVIGGAGVVAVIAAAFVFLKKRG